MTVFWLRNVLDKFGNEDAEVFINVSGVMFPLCGSVDKSILTFEYKSKPGLQVGQTVLTLKPCECNDEKEDKDKSENILLN